MSNKVSYFSYSIMRGDSTRDAELHTIQKLKYLFLVQQIVNFSLLPQYTIAKTSKKGWHKN
jgi:hypothetical protein